MNTLLERTLLERVEKGAGFLDRHYPGWWQHIDLGTLEIASCERCVLGQVYGQAGDAERGAVIAQAVEYWTFGSPLTLQGALAEEFVDTESPFGRMTSAFRELRYVGAIDHGFAWDSFMQERQEPSLTDMWTRLVIQRRLDAHVDVLLGSSELVNIPTENLVAV